MNIFSIVFTLVSFKLSGVPAQQAGAGRLRSLPSSPLDGDVEKRLPLSTEQPPGRRTERYACLIHTNKAAVDSCYSSVGRGRCKDRHGNYYGRAVYDRPDTNDLSAFSAEHCAYMCAGKPDGNQNLVGFDFADSIKVCACRFTAGYITDDNTTPGQGNCPRDASDPTSWGSKPCKPHTGVGAIDGSGGDDRSHCYRNNNFRLTPTDAPSAKGQSTQCSLVGNWIAENLPEGGDPGAPDETLINITENEVDFPNGGGGFANSSYQLKGNGCGTVFNEGSESVTFDLVGDKLTVVFSGGGLSQSAANGKFTKVVYRRVAPMDEDDEEGNIGQDLLINESL